MMKRATGDPQPALLHRWLIDSKKASSCCFAVVSCWGHSSFSICDRYRALISLDCLYFVCCYLPSDFLLLQCWVQSNWRQYLSVTSFFYKLLEVVNFQGKFFQEIFLCLGDTMISVIFTRGFSAPFILQFWESSSSRRRSSSVTSRYVLWKWFVLRVFFCLL